MFIRNNVERIFVVCGFSFWLLACGESGQSTDDPFQIDAGEDLVVQEQTFVTLDATASSDTSEALEVNWVQVEGEPVELLQSNTLRPGFRVPNTERDQELVLRMLVRSSSHGSRSDDVRVRISDRNLSSQGVDEDSPERRKKAKNRRSSRSPFIDGREVRTFDGSQNNLANSLWGASFAHLERWGPVDYGDLVASLSGQARPSAREISNAIAHQDAGVSISNTFGTTDFLWQWGQFLDHDIGITDGANEPADILVPAGDVFFDPQATGQQVISFNRALFDTETGTDVTNPRQQENEISAWIDGSMIYGSSDERAAALRVGEDSPYLATSTGNLLPFNTAGLTNANPFGVADDELFLGGDVRANEQVGLAVMHTLWVREHNRIAAGLTSEFPGEEAEEIFQAARRLVIAKIQKITYEEYLPAFLGDNALGNYSGYDAALNPGLFNEFSVAAYRHGHTLVNETLLRLDGEGNELDDGNLSLRESFFTAPSLLTTEVSLDPVLRGMSQQLSQALDTRVVSDLRNFLFGQPGQGGLDLVSLNIQRGRDHGVPSYNSMREVFGLPRRTSFSEITSDASLADALSSVYASVDEVDLWVGGLAEDALSDQGSQLGELFRAMIVDQFGRLRDADRFWYQIYLTRDELDRVQGTSLAKVIADNTAISVDELQKNVFFVE